MHLLEVWGCNSTCVTEHTVKGGSYNLGAAVEECQCPKGFIYNKTNEPFGDVDVNRLMSDD